MRAWKRGAALCLTAALLLSLLAGCAKEGEGMALAVSVGGAPVSLDPIYAEEAGDQTLLTHLYENLMRVSVDTSGTATVVNGMAKSVNREENHDGTVTYTFRLRSAKWSDGRGVRAQDFVYAWQRLADPASQSPYAALLSVVAGYDAVRAGGELTDLQVTAKNDNTLVVVLNGNYDWFLTEVCTSPATMPLRQDVVQRLKEAADTLNQPPADAEPADSAEPAADTDSPEDTPPAPPAKWWSDPTKLVTNGPYRADSYDDAALTMALSDRYYTSLTGPRTLTFRFAATAEDAWALYEAKEIDAVWPLPETELAALAAEEDWAPIPQLETYAVLFNSRRDVFLDLPVRQAMHLAIDRAALAAAAGGTALAAEGLVPPGVPESEAGDFRTVGGPLLDNDPETYADRCAQAKAILAEAGYDSGYSLGELEYLYVDEGNNAAVAQALAQMWYDALRLRVTPRAVTERELWAALRTGEYTLAGATLQADGNDAECFLMHWTTGSQDNVTGYANSAYDTLMNIIASAEDGSARMGCLHDAEDLLLEDCVVAPLYTSGTAWKLREGLTGACRDARGWFCFTGVMEQVL